MTVEYPFSLAQLAQILSALENERRNPNSKHNAIKAIERNAAQIGLTTEDVFAAADGLLSCRLSAGEFRAALRDEGGAPASFATEAPAEPAPVAGTAAMAANPATTETRVGGKEQLLAACQTVEHWLQAERGRPGETRPDEILRVLRAAIERAEGQRKPREPVQPRQSRHGPREGTKEALMIAMLRRPEGATVEQIAEAMGWARHTVRGAMAGALKKKLGLTITSEKTEGAARNYRIAE